MPTQDMPLVSIVPVNPLSLALEDPSGPSITKEATSWSSNSFEFITLNSDSGSTSSSAYTQQRIQSHNLKAVIIRFLKIWRVCFLAFLAPPTHPPTQTLLPPFPCLSLKVAKVEGVHLDTPSCICEPPFLSMKNWERSVLTLNNDFTFKQEYRTC